MFETVVKDVHFIDRKRLYQIGIQDGKLAAIDDEPLSGRRYYDAQGDLIFPPFVEAHTHMDTVFTASGRVNNESGTLTEGIRLWQERKKRLTAEDVHRRAIRALKTLIENGVLFVRAAVDISDPELTALKALLEVRAEMGRLIEMQIIAFPQDGLMACPENRDRLTQALELGADAAGAAPHLEHTREKGIASLACCFSVAKQFHKFVHVFCDEIDDGASRFLEVVADFTIDYKMTGMVTASHAIALSYYAEPYAQKVMQLVKNAGVNVVICPLINSVMQGRLDPYPRGRGITRVKDLNAIGVNVCLAHDDMQTPFYPLGSGSMLHAASLGLHLAHMTGETDLYSILNMITYNGQKALRIQDYGLEIGNSANFITLPAENIKALLSDQPKPRFVFKNGQLIVETKPCDTQWIAGAED